MVIDGDYEPHADIPADCLALHQRAATERPGLGWSILAAVGKIESDHGPQHPAPHHLGERNTMNPNTREGGQPQLTALTRLTGVF